MKTKEELLKIYSAYLPYELEVYRIEHKHETTKILSAYDLCPDGEIDNLKPVLYSMESLSQEELKRVGFRDHLDYLTNEREVWIKMYGIDAYLKKTPYGHIQYLISRHYNVFGLSESEYIKKETL